MTFSFLFMSLMGKPLWAWLMFGLVVAGLLALDLGVLHRKSREIALRESLVSSAVYIALGVAFGGWVWWAFGEQAGLNYLTGLTIEKALALDNVFVIALIFSYFGIPRAYQHRVLFWGVLGVIVLRAILIGLGASLIAQAHWVLYVFAVFLIATGVRMLTSRHKTYDVASNPLLRLIRRRFNVTDAIEGERFIVRRPDPDGRLRPFATPLLLALVMVEFADLVFAVDSIPAIFAITTDPFVVYTSNIFAVLGLRALYFALAAMVDRFAYLKYALALVLVFIGLKIFAADLLGPEKLPAWISLGVTFALLGGGILLSLLRAKRSPRPVDGHS